MLPKQIEQFSLVRNNHVLYLLLPRATGKECPERWHNPTVDLSEGMSDRLNRNILNVLTGRLLDASFDPYWVFHWPGLFWMTSFLVQL